jgi:hypothetical protein
MNRSPFVIVTVLNFNRAEDTIACVRSILACDYQDKVIIVFDNCSSDDSVEQFKRSLPGIEVVEIEKNRGYTGGVNVSLSYAKAKQPDYILVINNDTEVDKFFLRHLVDSLEFDRNAAVACGTIFCHHDRSRIWYGGGRLVPWRGLAIHENKGRLLQEADLGKPKLVSFVTGCMILFRSSSLNAIGMEDERFFLYLDDVELSARIQSRGYSLLYVPKSIIYHKVLGERESSFKLYYSVRNRLLLIQTAFSGFARVIAFGYFSIAIAAKLMVWSFWKPHFFRAALSGLSDYLTQNFYQGRGFQYLTDNPYTRGSS